MKLTVSSDMQPKIDDIKFVLMTPDRNYSYPMIEADKLANNSAFNPNWKTVILVTGWTTSFSGNNAALYGMYHAYMCKGHINFIVSFRLIETKNVILILIFICLMKYDRS